LKRILLIHWDEPEAKLRAARLQALGYGASFATRTGPRLMDQIRDDPPSAVVIDLSRLPSQGRDVGIALRVRTSTRSIPLVFVGGLIEKVAVVKASLPDAMYTTWDHIRQDLERAIARPPFKPVVPDSLLAGYSGRSLAAKLGLKSGTITALLGAPNDFVDALEPLPAGVELRRQMSDDCTLTLWFVRSPRELEQGISLRAARLGEGKLWILWPKKASGVGGGLTQTSVRDAGLSGGLVDYKIASIDATWSGLLFTRRKPSASG
jgi:hypothetical protein